MQPLLQMKSNKYYIRVLYVFVALGIQPAMRMRYTVIGGLSACAVFFQLSHKRHDFRKKGLLNKKCVLIFSTTFV